MLGKKVLSLFIVLFFSCPLYAQSEEDLDRAMKQYAAIEKYRPQKIDASLQVKDIAIPGGSAVLAGLVTEFILERYAEAGGNWKIALLVSAGTYGLIHWIRSSGASNEEENNNTEIYSAFVQGDKNVKRMILRKHPELLGHINEAYQQLGQSCPSCLEDEK